MKTRAAQWTKEARQLAWPWTILMVAGFIVLARPWYSALPPMGGVSWQHLTEWMLPVGAFFGSSLLAALPLGSEFQFRTLAMRFAQPVDRHLLWREKFLATAAAVAPIGLIYCIAIYTRFGVPFTVMAGSFIVVTIAGIIPFTMIARSTLGGMVLNQFGTTGVTLAWAYYEKHDGFPPLLLATIGIALATYCAVMIWLGRRMFLRFQAVEGMQATEAFVPGARLVPNAVAEWFRCRPHQRFGNLVRREFRLMRSLWPLTVLYLAAWIFLVVFRQLPNENPGSLHVAFAVTVILAVIISVLAGTLSLGEEKTWGTHDWHMTMPAAIPLQWAVKIVFAVLTSLVCVALLPMAILTLDAWLRGTANPFLTGDIAFALIAECVGTTLIAFWCACVVKGTVQATLWVFPLCFAVGFAGTAGLSVFGFFSHPLAKLIERVMSRFDVVAIARWSWPIVMANEKVLPMAAAAMLFTVGLIQSLRAFRAQVGANKLRVVRAAIPLLAISFACGFIGAVINHVAYESWHLYSTVLQETDSAINALQKGTDDPTKLYLHRLSVDDLGKAAPLSDVTKRWLREANVYIGPPPPRFWNVAGPHIPGSRMFVVPQSKMNDRMAYSAVIRKPSGSGCSMTFQLQTQNRFGYVTAICE